VDFVKQIALKILFVFWREEGGGSDGGGVTIRKLLTRTIPFHLPPPFTHAIRERGKRKGGRVCCGVITNRSDRNPQSIHLQTLWQGETKRGKKKKEVEVRFAFQNHPPRT